MEICQKIDTYTDKSMNQTADRQPARIAILNTSYTLPQNRILFLMDKPAAFLPAVASSVRAQRQRAAGFTPAVSRLLLLTSVYSYYAIFVRTNICLICQCRLILLPLYLGRHIIESRYNIPRGVSNGIDISTKAVFAGYFR